MEKRVYKDQAGADVMGCVGAWIMKGITHLRTKFSSVSVRLTVIAIFVFAKLD